jgi:hypothetical protein
MILPLTVCISFVFKKLHPSWEDQQLREVVVLPLPMPTWMRLPLLLPLVNL